MPIYAVWKSLEETLAMESDLALNPWSTVVTAEWTGLGGPVVDYVMCVSSSLHMLDEATRAHIFALTAGLPLSSCS